MKIRDHFRSFHIVVIALGKIDDGSRVFLFLLLVTEK